MRGGAVGVQGARVSMLESCDGDLSRVIMIRVRVLPALVHPRFCYNSGISVVDHGY